MPYDVAAFLESANVDITPEVTAIARRLGVKKRSDLLELDVADTDKLQQSMSTIDGKRFARALADLKATTVPTKKAQVCVFFLAAPLRPRLL